MRWSEAVLQWQGDPGMEPFESHRAQLTALEFAKRVEDMNTPGWPLHPLKGELRGFYSVTMNGNWRLIFRFEKSDAELVDYLDYH